MIARPSWFWSSLFSSLTVNGVLFVSGACYLYSQTPIWEPPWPDGSSLAVQDDPIFIPRIADTLLGESTGKGNATDASPGDKPMEARLADQDQSFLSRDPEGPGHVGDPPSMSTQIPGENGNGDQGKPAQFGLAMEDQSAKVDPIFARPPRPTPPQATSPQVAQRQSSDAADESASAANPNLIAESSDANTNTPTSKPTLDKRSAVATIDQVAPPSPPDKTTETSPQPTRPATPTPQPTVQPTPQQKASQSSSAGGGKPGPTMAPADPAPQSDTESDPFANKGVVVFRPGATKIQFGRKHKLVRPQIGLAGQTAMLQLRQPVVLVLALSLDETGKVTHVTVLQSSGSKDIDQACKVAAYQWWIEPSKDKDGKAVKDVIPFVIGFS